MLTNRFKYAALGTYFRADATQEPTGFRARLITSAAAITADTNLASELTELANGNGYTTGGIALGRNSTDFDVLTEDDVNDRALVQIRDLVWTAAGGPIPASGAGASELSLEDDEVSPQVIGGFSLTGPITVSDGQTLTVQDAEIRLT